MRWTLQHPRELVPTPQHPPRHSHRRQPARRARNPLDGFVFEDDKGKKITIAEWQKTTYTDALVVMHKGRVVYERYHNQDEAGNAAPAVLGNQVLHRPAGRATDSRGQARRQALVTKYVPELADSAWGDMKVRDVLDMTGAVRFREVYTDPTTEIFGYSFSSGMLPPPPNYSRS